MKAYYGIDGKIHSMEDVKIGGKKEIYTVELSPKQYATTLRALNIFMRLEVGQFGFALGGFVADDEFIEKLNEEQRDWLLALNENPMLNDMKVKRNDIAYDLVQVLRHQIWKENENRSSVTVDSNVTQLSSEPLAVVKKEEVWK